MYISKLEIFGDVGFVEGGVEVPSLEDFPLNPLMTFEDLHPSRDDLFSSVKLKTEYAPLISASYLRITYDKIAYPIYAWVDTVSVLSDSEDPVTRISFHIDLWRTYLTQANFGYGLVSRRPRGSDDPIQHCSYRYRRIWDDPKPLIYVKEAGIVDGKQYGNVWWIILNAVTENSDGQVTSAITYFSPVFSGEYAWNQSVYTKYNTGYTSETVAPCMPLVMWITGAALSKMGMSARQVSSCFISPVCPIGVGVGTGVTRDDAFLVYQDFSDHSSLGHLTVDSYTMYFSNTMTYTIRSMDITLKTTDTEEAVITDFDGSPLGTVPWGISVSSLSYRVVLSAVSAYLDFRADGINSAAEGLHWAVPLPSVDVVSNSWSDYVYSGQREYDIEQKRLAAKQALIQGLTGAAESTVSAGIMGGIGAGVKGAQASQIAELINGTKIGGRGAAAKKAQMISGVNNIIGSVGGVGALGSAGAMLGVSAGSALIGYALTTHYNQQLQGMEDQLQAKQFDSIQIAGGGWDFLRNGRLPCAVNLEVDTYSEAWYRQNIDLNGIECSEPRPNCNSLVKSGGPLQITQLVVAGEIPPQAKAEISQTLARGVRILTKNKETTV